MAGGLSSPVKIIRQRVPWACAGAWPSLCAHGLPFRPPVSWEEKNPTRPSDTTLVTSAVLPNVVATGSGPGSLG